MKIFLKILFVLPVVFVAALIVFFYRNHVVKRPQPAAANISGKPLVTQAIGPFTVNLFTPGEQLRSAGNDVVIEFRDPAGESVDVGSVKLEFSLNISGAPIRKIVRVEGTAAVGQYRAIIQPEVGGEWTAKIRFDGPRGSAEKSFPVMVK